MWVSLCKSILAKERGGAKALNSVKYAGELKRQQKVHVIDIEQEKGKAEGNYVSGQGLDPVELHKDFLFQLQAVIRFWSLLTWFKFRDIIVVPVSRLDF